MKGACPGVYYTSRVRAIFKDCTDCYVKKGVTTYGNIKCLEKKTPFSHYM